MNKMYILLIAVVLIVGMVVFCSCTRHTDENSISLDESSLNSLKLSFLSGKITLHPADDSYRIDYKIIYLSPFNSKPNVQVSANNGETEIRTEKFHAFLYEFTADIYLPLDILKTLEVDMTSGFFKAEALCLDKLEFDTTSGTVEITHSEITQSDIDITSGKFTAQGSFDKIDCDITSGNVVLTSDTFATELDVDITSGTFSLSMPEDDLGFSLSYEKTSGTIHTGFPVSGSSTARNGMLTYNTGFYKYSLHLTSGVFNLKKI